METKTSPPRSMRAVMTMSWELEKASISIVDMVASVAEETDMKNKSRSLDLMEGSLESKHFKRR